MGTKITYEGSTGERIEVPVTDTNTVSDGFHTFGELYEHRIILFACLSLVVRERLESWVSKLHHDGTGYEGWFIGGIRLPTGDITYHMPMEHWDLLAEHAQVLERGKPWDGHTSEDVLKRLHQWAKAGCPPEMP